MKTILATGGLGFIGLNYILNNKNRKIICVDNKSYAANVSQLKYQKKLPPYNCKEVIFKLCVKQKIAPNKN